MLAEAATFVSQLSACVPPFTEEDLPFLLNVNNMYAEQPVTSPDSNVRRLNRLHHCFGLYHFHHFEINFDIYKKHGSYFQCFCATVLEKLSHPQSQALHCLLAEHSTASLSDVVFVPSISIIQSDNAPK